MRAQQIKRGARSSLFPAAVTAVALASPACAGMKPFRVSDAPPPKPSPAALDDAEIRVPPSLPFAWAQDDDYVVRVVADSVTCSGTLIAEDQVLTAHHCISGRDKYGDFVHQDVDAKSIKVELGGDYLPWGEVGVRALVAPPCGHAAGVGDIAILVLERKLIGVATVGARLSGPPKKGESVEPVGFGRCALSTDGIRRRQRSGGAVEDVLDTRFRLHASICPGDSGGPVLSTEGEVVGVISAAVMDGRETTRERAEFTRLDRWRPVFATAKLIADGQSPAEVPPVDGCPAP